MVQTLSDVCENLTQGSQGGKGCLYAGSFFQPVFQKVFELPHIKTEIETLLKGNAGIVTFLGATDLKHRELVNRFAIPGKDFTFRQALDTIPQSDVAQIF